MSKVITFSRTFPAYHPRKGEPTYFVEQTLNSLFVSYKNHSYLEKLFELNRKNISIGKLTQLDLSKFQDSLIFMDNHKIHTIRGGCRFSSKDFFSPRVWFKTPYNSPQIIFWHDVEVKKTWDFEMDLAGIYSVNGKYLLSEECDDTEILLAKNDGFKDPSDMFNWFMPNYDKPKEFSGQIICWNENINY